MNFVPLEHGLKQIYVYKFMQESRMNGGRHKVAKVYSVTWDMRCYYETFLLIADV